MGRPARDYDESDVRIRPNRRGTRPRTKDRPSHSQAVPGQVIGVDRGRFTVLVGGTSDAASIDPDAGTAQGARTVTAMRARELVRTRLVVGDRVALVGDTSGDRDALARIVRLEERTTALRRSADDTDPVERVIVANADQLVIVSALANPQPRPRLIDRCLVAAYDADLDPLLVLTKSDLADPAPFLASYAPLAVPYVVTTSRNFTTTGLAELRRHLSRRVSVLVGHSGVGKSTLVNALVPLADRAIGEVNDVTGRGRHTSTSAVALPLPDGAGWVIDTPGVRSFGLAHVDLTRIVQHFPDLAPGAQECPRGCSHDEEECALDAWVESGAAGTAGQARLESLRRLLRTRSTQHGD